MSAKTTPEMLREKFEARFIPEPNSGCWLWEAGISSSGYGKFYRTDISKSGQEYAHRMSWMIYRGEIEGGLFVDHRVCRNKLCVNPDHMVVCTNRENVLQPDGSPAIKKAKSHCPHGHLYEGVNLIITRGTRECRTCVRARGRSRYHRMKGNSLCMEHFEEWSADALSMAKDA